MYRDYFNSYACAYAKNSVWVIYQAPEVILQMSEGQVETANPSASDEDDSDDSDDSEEDNQDDSGEDERGRWKEEPIASVFYKPIRRNPFKMPDFELFQQMDHKDRVFNYNKCRRIQTKQLHLIAALQQQLNAERTSNALLKSDNQSTYRLEVDAPYDKCEFPREIGDGQGPPDRARVDCDWVVLRRSTQLFDVKIVHVDPSQKHSTCTVDPFLGTDSGNKSLMVEVTLCDEMGEKIEDDFLAFGQKSQPTNLIRFEMKTNATSISFMIKTTSAFLKTRGIGDGKVLLKFETKFKDKPLEFKTRPFYITTRISTGKVNTESWSPGTLNAVCDECAQCSKRLKTNRVL